MGSLDAVRAAIAAYPIAPLRGTPVSLGSDDVL
jgi:hypothetical protein